LTNDSRSQLVQLRPLISRYLSRRNLHDITTSGLGEGIHLRGSDHFFFGP
jgi:hypothetical protein